MKFGRIVQAAALVAAALMIGGATARSNWDATVVRTDGAHRIGNPEAKVKLTEFISYTCPHCAAFAREGEPPLKLGYVMQGKVSVEIRHLIRDPVDLTAGMLVQCGAASKFTQNHTMFMLRQSQWIAPMSSATAAQKQRWSQQNAAGRRAIASDFGFYKLMEGRGYRRTDIDRCLNDEAVAKAMAARSAKDWDRPGVDSTPTFAINGVVMPGTHDWRALQKQLDEFL
jgi:protein-disulfide isomerase